MEKQRIMVFLKAAYLYLESFFLRLKKKKDILFVVINRTMFSYVRPIYERLKEDKRLRLWFLFYRPERFKPEDLEQIKRKYFLKTVNKFMANYFKWDLVVYPDHGFNVRKDCLKIYVGHGAGGGGKAFEAGESYVYGSRSKNIKGEIIYSKIFVGSENELARVKRCYPEFHSRVRVVGNLLLDEMDKYISLKSEIFKDAGLDFSRKTVMIVSTWGSDSLIQSFGLEMIKKIPKLAEKYNVVLTIHHNNYVKEYSGGIDWEQKLKAIEHKNVFVLYERRDPFFLLANADILISDITSLSLYFPHLLRPMILLYNSDIKCEKENIFEKTKANAYLINNVDNLETDIEKAFSQFDKAKMFSFAQSIFSYQGQAWKRYKAELYDSLSLDV
ncbi:MAG: CDP-glycerol glycerophosphotransferase family protein [Candidatus Omnitrophica bacterium]|nr:CDP-glycerol glycerophosphotransferase family protein [Candidatus Omnitrophota bacterium]